MIDLKNTYIVNDNGELRDLYISEAKIQGYKTHFMGIDFDVLHIGSDHEMVIHGVSGSSCHLYTSDRKKITIEDMKPKQEWNGEGLPPVGVECEIKHKNAN